MKRCPYCNKTFPDSAMRCPEDEVFLMSVTALDMDDPQNQSGKALTQDREDGDSGVSRQRARIQAVDFESGRVSRTESVNDKASILKTGRNIFRQESRVQNDNNSKISNGGVHVVRKSGSFRRMLPVLRIVVPAILLLISIILIIVFWEHIRPVLSCLMIGAIIGGSFSLFLVLRFGRHFNIDAVFSGAIVGGLLACFIQYNVLDIGTEINELIYAIGPVVIILIAILWVIRSMFR